MNRHVVCSSSKWRAVAIHEEPDLRQITRRLYSYLQKHPESADTITGVIDWWLRPMRFTHRTRPLVERALHGLVARGLLMQRVGADGNVIYVAVPRPDIDQDE